LDFVGESLFFLHLKEAQRHAQYRGRSAFVRQAECAHKKKSRRAVTWIRGPGFGSSFFETEKPFGVVELNGKTAGTGNTMQVHLRLKFEHEGNVFLAKMLAL